MLPLLAPPPTKSNLDCARNKQAAANAAAAAGSAVSGDAAESKGMVNGTSETAVKIAIGTGGGGSSISACFGCGVACSITNVSPHGALCNSCFHHWRYVFFVSSCPRVDDNALSLCDRGSFRKKSLMRKRWNTTHKDLLVTFFFHTVP